MRDLSHVGVKVLRGLSHATVGSCFFNLLRHFCSRLACSTSNLFILPLLFFFNRYIVRWLTMRRVMTLNRNRPKMKLPVMLRAKFPAMSNQPLMRNLLKLKFHLKLALVKLKNLNRYLSVLFAKVAAPPQVLQQMQDGESEKSCLVGFVDKG